MTFRWSREYANSAEMSSSTILSTISAITGEEGQFSNIKIDKTYEQYVNAKCNEYQTHTHE